MSLATDRKSASRKALGKGALLKDIRTRLVIAITLVTFSVSLVGLVFNLKRDMKRMREATVETNLVRLKALKIDFVKVITEYSSDYAVDLVDRLASFSDIRNVVLHDNEGRLVFRYDHDPSDRLVLPGFVDFTRSSAIIYSADGLLMHHTVSYEGNQYGWVTIRVSTLELQDQLREYALTALLLVIGTVLIAFVLSVLVSHLFTHPIRNLAAFTRKISRTHKLDQQVYTREGGDIGDLYDGINTMLKDISAAEEEIQRLNDSRMRNIIDSSQDGVISFCDDGLISYWGKQNIKIFGWLEQDVLGKSVIDLIIPERYRDLHRGLLQEFLLLEAHELLNQRLSMLCLHSGGREVPIEFSLAANKEAGRWVFNAFIRDLTELREAERELHEAQIQLLRKERLATVGQLTATVAHELRNPMGTIRNSLYTLGKKLEGDGSDTVELLERVDRNIERCDTIISDLLDFTRDREIMLLPTPIVDWLNGLLDKYDCPEEVELVRIFSLNVTGSLDVSYFESAVINILDNAVQAVLEQYPQGGGRIEVDVIFNNGRAGVVISDNGVGLTAEQQLHVFEPLYSTKVYGVGLGLPTVRKILEKHRGEVILEARNGGGTRVSMWINADEGHETSTLQDER